MDTYKVRVKKAIPYIIIAILAGIIIWTNFVLNPIHDDSKVKELIKQKEIDSIYYLRKYDSLNFVIEAHKDTIKILKDEENKSNKEWKKVRSNPISDIASDSMRRAIIKRGAKRFD